MLEIESWEDRSGVIAAGGDKTQAYGYVYFSDGSRVGFTPGLDDHEDVWEPRTNGGGKFQPVSVVHLEMARDLLKAEGIIRLWRTRLRGRALRESSAKSWTVFTRICISRLTRDRPAGRCRS